MNQLREIFERVTLATGGPDLETALIALIVSVVLGMFIAWIYLRTHTGLSYSQSFAQSLVLLTMIVCLVMMIIGNNLLTAFGLLGALAVIRFRNVLKDTRDTIFVFFALALGMAAGTGRPLLGVLGAVTISAVVLLLWGTSFGARQRFDSYLRFILDESAGSVDDVVPLLRRHCHSSRLVARRIEAAADAGEVAFRLSLRDPFRVGEMVEEVKRIPGVSDVSMVVQEEQAEV